MPENSSEQLPWGEQPHGVLNRINNDPSLTITQKRQIGQGLGIYLILNDDEQIFFKFTLLNKHTPKMATQAQTSLGNRLNWEIDNCHLPDYLLENLKSAADELATMPWDNLKGVLEIKATWNDKVEQYTAQMVESTPYLQAVYYDYCQWAGVINQPK